MSCDVVSAHYIGEYRLQITFEDGRFGIVDFAEFIKKGGVFEKLRDLDFFKTFTIDPELKVITWGGEIDIAPETLYSKATGDPLPEWMQEEESLP